MYLRLCCLALLVSTPLAASDCAPSVFLDSNRNGQRDGRESGLPDVRISDGERIVITDRNGIYSLAATPGRTLFVIKPAGYTLPRRADGLPDSFANQPGTLHGLKYGGVKCRPAATVVNVRVVTTAPRSYRATCGDTR